MAGTAERVVLKGALQGLIAEAREHAQNAVHGSAEREFYAGVVRAAEQHLHASGRATQHDQAWLAREPHAFREGYLKASTLIGTVIANPPAHLRLPAPDH